MFENKLYFDNVSKQVEDEFKSKILDEYHSKKIGYYILPHVMDENISKANALLKKHENLKDIVVIGIGGSSLGAKAIASMLNVSDVRFHFLENLDSKNIFHTLSKLDFHHSIFFIISKSGTTLETITLSKVVLGYFKLKPSMRIFSEKFIIITDPHSPLEIFARDHNVDFFNIPQNVGGRFSVFSSSAIVPLVFGGVDVKSILNGALKCKEDFFEKNIHHIIHKAHKYVFGGKSINVVFSYGDLFREFNAWYVQLWGESLGKISHGKSVGLTPVGLIGSIDQHSFLQLIMQGVRDKTVTFIKMQENDNDIIVNDVDFDCLSNSSITTGFSMHTLLNMQCDATMQSVLSENIITDTISIQSLDEWHIGYLMYYYELLTSMCGIMLEINTYDQPGVEVGKKILKDMLLKKA